jgi:hypothetical protein
LLYCAPSAIHHNVAFFQQRAFPSAASPVHLFDRALLISFVAFAFVRPIAASSPLSTFATPQAHLIQPHHEINITAALL